MELAVCQAILENCTKINSLIFTTPGRVLSLFSMFQMGTLRYKQLAGHVGEERGLQCGIP